MIGRRALFAGVMAGAVVLTAGPALAATANVTWTAAYTGADYSTIATLLAGFGSNLTNASTGHITGTSTSGTIIQLAAAEGAKDYTGHPLTISGVTNMITSYNTGTQVATVSATIAYPTGTFGSTPAPSTAYSIADVNVTLQIGQSAAGNNKWSIASALTLGAITTSSTDAILLTGATAPNANQPLGVNTSGATNNTVLIAVSGGNTCLTTTPDNLTISNLQLLTASASRQGLQTNGSTNQNINGVMMISTTDRAGALTAGTVRNSVFITTSGNGMSGGTTHYGCTFAVGGNPTDGGYGTATSVDCVFLRNAGYQTNGHSVYTTCLSDKSSPPSGVTLIASGSAVYSTSTGAIDLRPIPGSTLLLAVPFNAQLTVDIYGVARPGSGSITAGCCQAIFTEPSLATIAYAVNFAGDITALTSKTVFDDHTGPDLTYYSLGNVCPSTAADSSHIVVDASETAASIVGHAIRDNTLGVTCLATGISGSIVAVSALAGYPANFGSTPQSGDSYTVFPIAAVFNVGESSSGHNKWNCNQSTSDNTGALYFSGVTSAASTITVQGTIAFDPTKALGPPIDGQSAAIIYNDGDHNSLFQFNTGNVFIKNLQLDGGGGSPSNGIWQSTVAADGIWFIKCNMYGEVGSTGGPPAGGQHGPLGSVGSSQVATTVRLRVCSVLGTWSNPEIFTGAVVDAKFCSFAATGNIRLTTTAICLSGTNILTFTSVPSALFAPGGPGGGPYITGHANVGTGNIVNTKTATTITMLNNATGNIPSGTTLAFSMHQIFAAGATLDSCSLFGAAILPSSGNTYTNCASDLTGTGVTGSLVYANQFMSADQATFGTEDVRPKAGNTMNVGVFDAAFPTDLYGQAYAATNPTAGAVQFQSATTSGANFFHASPF